MIECDKVCLKIIQFEISYKIYSMRKKALCSGKYNKSRNTIFGFNPIFDLPEKGRSTRKIADCINHPMIAFVEIFEWSSYERLFQFNGNFKKDSIAHYKQQLFKRIFRPILNTCIAPK